MDAELSHQRVPAVQGHQGEAPGRVIGQRWRRTGREQSRAAVDSAGVLGVRHGRHSHTRGHGPSLRRYPSHTRPGATPCVLCPLRHRTFTDYSCIVNGAFLTLPVRQRPRRLPGTRTQETRVLHRNTGPECPPLTTPMLHAHGFPRRFSPARRSSTLPCTRRTTRTTCSRWRYSSSSRCSATDCWTRRLPSSSSSSTLTKRAT